MFSDRDKAAVRAIVSVFETGAKHGDPGKIGVLADGAGLSYGMHQATRGALLEVIRRYIAAAGAEAAALQPWLPGLTANVKTPSYAMARNAGLQQILKQAGHDPLMRAAQEAVFDELYMNPSVKAADGSGFTLPLTLAAIYDSHIQGGYSNVLARVPGGLGERDWTARFIDEREGYLKDLAAGKRRRGDVAGARTIAATVYRPQALRALLQAGNWGLATPFSVRGVTVAEADLA